MANVLFVDNPVGTGYSYCDSDSAFTTDVSEIATDLVTLYSAFLEKLPVFEVRLLRQLSWFEFISPYKLINKHIYMYIHVQRAISCKNLGRN